METKKIRIGNDIKLAVDLRLYLGGSNSYLREKEVYDPNAEDFNNIDRNPFVNKKYEVYYPNQYENVLDENSSSETVESDGTAVCIRSVKAILINTTRQKEYMDALRAKSRFIDRFPMEPRLAAFNATPYDVCNSGLPTWRAFPVYPGFGVNPDFRRLRNRKPLPFEYTANVAATSSQSVVEVSFPAEHLLFTGMYKLIIVAKLYAPGYSSDNLKTVTLDVPDVFELVSTSEEGYDTGFYIDVLNIMNSLPSEDDSSEPLMLDIYVRRGWLNESNLLLNRTDDSTVDIDLSSITDWYDID